MEKKTRRPDVIDRLMRKKGHLLRVSVKTKNPRFKEELEKAVNLCDVKIMRFHNRGRNLIQRAKDGLLESLLVLALLLLITGCTASVGGGASVSAFYPKKWESPASRKQHTQPTLGMARNNLPMVGGGK